MKPVEDSHCRYQQLIPWYVNGTLDEAEMDAFGRHLAGCDYCRQEVESDLRFARRYSASGDASAQSSAATGLTRLMQTIESVKANAGPENTHRLDQPETPAQKRPGIHPIAGLVVLAVLVSVGLLLLLAVPEERVFRTLTQSPPPVSGVVLQVTFEPDARESEIRSLLNDAGVTIIHGPSQQGVYRLALQATADKREVLAKLHDHPATRLLEEEIR